LEGESVRLGNESEEVAMEDIMGDGDRGEDGEIVANTSKVDGIAGCVSSGANLGEITEGTVNNGDVLFDKASGESESVGDGSRISSEELLDTSVLGGVGGEGFGEGGDVGGHGPIVESNETHRRR
jgi:hypothetical protein